MKIELGKTCAFQYQLCSQQQSIYKYHIFLLSDQVDPDFDHYQIISVYRQISHRLYTKVALINILSKISWLPIIPSIAPLIHSVTIPDIRSYQIEIYTSI